jgi:DNA polymerase-3 subunit gamma/tau
MTFDEILTKGFNALHFVAALSSHLRDLIVTKSGGLDALLELPDSLKKRYAEQAERCPLQFLYEGLSVTTQCESGYRASVNPRLHIEFALMKLSFLNAKMPASAPVTPAVPAAPTVQAAPVAPATPVTPVAPVATPAPAPVVSESTPVASELVAEVQPRERRTRAARASLSLKSMMDDTKETAPVQVKEEEGLPSDEVLRSKWPELSGKYSDKPRLASMLNTTTLDIVEADGFKTVTFQVVNDAQKDWVESKLLHELEGNYRKMIGSMKIYLRVAVAVDDTPDQKKIYMPGDQAKELMAQNSEVEELVKALDLDIK